MSAIFIQEITVKTKLTWYWKVKDQIDIIERLWTKLKYDINDRNQLSNLPIKFFLQKHKD